MFLAGLLNARHLFQTVGSLSDSGVSDFLFRATSAVVHLDRISELQRQCLFEFQVFAAQTDVRRPRIVLSSPSVVALVNEIPPLLNTMRIMQDLMLPMVARAVHLRRSVPLSLNDAVGRLHTSGLPDQVQSRTRQYWEVSGSKVKQYRDLDQHFKAVVDHVLLEVHPRPRMLVLLPDDPSQRRRDAFTFRREINALDFLPAALGQLHDWAEALALATGVVPGPISQSTQTSQLGHLVPPVGGTLALLIEHGLNGGRPCFSGFEVAQLPDCRVRVTRLPTATMVPASPPPTCADTGADAPSVPEGGNTP